MRVGVMVGSRFKVSPERSVRGDASKVNVAKVKSDKPKRKRRVKKNV